MFPVSVSQRPVCYRQGIQPGTAGKGHSLALLGGIEVQGSQSGIEGRR